MTISRVGTTGTIVSTESKTSHTLSYTVVSGNNRLLVVSVACHYAQNVSSVTFDGVALTEQVSRKNSSGTGPHTYIFTLINPPVTTANIVATFSAATQCDWICAVQYQNDSGGYTFTSNVAGTTSGTSHTLNITTTVANSILLGAGAAYGGDTDPGSTSYTEIWDSATGTSTYTDISSYVFERVTTTVGSYTMNYTAAVSDDWTLCVLEIASLAYVGPNPPINTKLHFYSVITDISNTDFESDNFNDNSLDSGIWPESEGTVQETGGQLVVTSSPSTGVISNPTTGDFDISFKFVSCNSTTLDTVMIGIFGISYKYLYVMVNGTSIQYSYSGSSGNGNGSICNNDYPVWIRFRLDSGTIYLYYSFTEPTSLDDWSLVNSFSFNDPPYYFGVMSNSLIIWDSYTSPYLNNVTEGSNGNASWVDLANIIDGSTSTSASITLGVSGVANTLTFTTNTNAISTGDIDKVTVTSNGSYSLFHTFTITPVFNGTNGSTYSLSSGGILQNIDITEDSNAPSTWTWTDINNLDFLVNVTGNLDTTTISKIWIEISYIDSETPTVITIDDFTVLDKTVSQINDVELYPVSTSMTETLKVYAEGQINYAHLRTLDYTGDEKTNLRIQKGGVIYQLIKKYVAE